MGTLPIELSQLLALNAELPTGYRTPFPDTSSTHVMHQAIESLKGIRLLNTAQAKEIETLKREVAGEKEQKKSAPQTSSAARNDAVEVETIQTLTQERTDYQFCIMELVMYITGEGETRGKVDFRKLREVLEGAREGGWDLKMLADAIEGVAPADQEAIKKRREMWM